MQEDEAELLRNSKHEEQHGRHQRMALSQNTHVYMETVETSKNKERNLIKMGVHEYYANMAANCRGQDTGIVQI